ncbi:MAG: hypothetical protein AAF423_03010 [Pseudomonadota bacterium]
MDERVWNDEPLSENVPLRIGSTLIRRAAPPDFAYLITGDLEKNLHRLDKKTKLLGLGEDSGGAETYSMRIGRDNALLVSGSTIGEDLQKAGFAASGASDVYVPVEIDGPEAVEILAQCGLAFPLAPSPSAAVLFGGLTALYVRNIDTHVIWVPAAYLTYMTSFLKNMGL